MGCKYSFEKMGNLVICTATVSRTNTSKDYQAESHSKGNAKEAASLMALNALLGNDMRLFL